MAYMGLGTKTQRLIYFQLLTHMEIQKKHNLCLFTAGIGPRVEQKAEI